MGELNFHKDWSSTVELETVAAHTSFEIDVKLELRLNVLKGSLRIKVLCIPK